MTPSKTIRFTLAVLCAAPLYLANCSSSSSSTGGNGGAAANSDGGDGDGDPSAGDGDPVAGDGDDDSDAAAGDGDPVAGDGDDGDAAAGDGDDNDTDAAAGDGDGDGDGGDTTDSGGGGGNTSACYTASEYGDSCVEGAPGQWTEANCGDPRDACPGGWYGKCTIGDNLSRSYFYSAGIGQNACNIGQGVWEEGDGP
jgi:hypothetical protein